MDSATLAAARDDIVKRASKDGLRDPVAAPLLKVCAWVACADVHSVRYSLTHAHCTQTLQKRGASKLSDTSVEPLSPRAAVEMLSPRPMVTSATTGATQPATAATATASTALTASGARKALTAPSAHALVTPTPAAAMSCA
jgi:hypothetical protein